MAKYSFGISQLVLLVSSLISIIIITKVYMDRALMWECVVSVILHISQEKEQELFVIFLLSHLLLYMKSNNFTSVSFLKKNIYLFVTVDSRVIVSLMKTQIKEFYNNAKEYVASMELQLNDCTSELKNY